MLRAQCISQDSRKAYAQKALQNRPARAVHHPALGTLPLPLHLPPLSVSTFLQAIPAKKIIL